MRELIAHRTSMGVAWKVCLVMGDVTFIFLGFLQNIIHIYNNGMWD